MINAAVRKMMSHASPHMRALGYEVVELKDGVCCSRLPYAVELVGDPTTGVLHGGVVVSLLDSSAGAAVFSALGKPKPIATLDLRIDYLRPSTPGEALHARVECYKVTRSVAFTRGVAHNGDPDDAVAALSATFMLNTRALPRTPEGQ